MRELFDEVAGRSPLDPQGMKRLFLADTHPGAGGHDTDVGGDRSADGSRDH